MTEYLGSQKVNRSAYAVKEATPTTIYLGVCPRDNRPVRFEMPADLGKSVELPCFAGCTLPVRCERLYAVETHLECDGSCMGARGPFCSCGCGGINHGAHWSKGALLDHRELVESEIEKYRAEQVKIAVKREARREARARQARRSFEDWAAQNAEAIGWLMTSDPEAERSGFVADMIRKLRRAEILSPNMLAAVLKIHAERAARAEQDAARDRERAERDARRATKPGSGDQSQLVPGVYRLGADVFVVKGNKPYLSWRKHDPQGPRPQDARLYAKRLAESAPRVTEAGTEIPFELVYAPGVIYDLALSDRMPLAEAEELATRYAACIVCGTTLKAAKSVRRLIGPVCRKYFGDVTQSEAA